MPTMDCLIYTGLIRSIAQQNQKELYQTLCILSPKIDTGTFETKFIKTWTPIEPEFVKYFSEHYQNRASN